MKRNDNSSRRSSGNYPPMCRTGSYSSDSSTVTVQFMKKQGKSLQELMFDGEWDVATAYIRLNGRLAMKKIIAPRFMNRVFDSEVLPIHYALSLPGVTVEFLEALIFAYPRGLEKKELSYNRTCFHIALRSLVPDEIITFLILRHPYGVSVQDTLGRLPLHYALSNMRSIEVIKQLLAADPKTLRAGDKEGWTPLHVALGNHTSYATIKMLISMSPDIVLQRSHDKKRTSLSCINRNREDKEQVAVMIKEAIQVYEDIPLFQNMQKSESKRKLIGRVMRESYFV